MIQLDLIIGVVVLGVAGVLMVYLVLSSGRGVSSPGAQNGTQVSDEPALCTICESEETTSRVNGEPVCSDCKKEYYEL